MKIFIFIRSFHNQFDFITNIYLNIFQSPIQCESWMFLFLYIWFIIKLSTCHNWFLILLWNGPHLFGRRGWKKNCGSVGKLSSTSETNDIWNCVITLVFPKFIFLIARFSISVLAAFTCVLSVPFAYNYIQHIQSVLTNEAAFCKVFTLRFFSNK